MIAQTIFPLSIREFPKFLFASQGALQDVTTYSLLMTLLSMLGGITLSLTQPLFGGMSDAWAQGDTPWVKKTDSSSSNAISSPGCLSCCGWRTRWAEPYRDLGR